MDPSPVDWIALDTLARRLSEPGTEPGSIAENEWQVISHALETLGATHDWSGIIRLRQMFTALFARDTIWGLSVMQQLDEAALVAARHRNDKPILAHLLGARAHNLHRQGYHNLAIVMFTESAALYKEIGHAFNALKSYYMTSLCHRALGDRKQAHQVLTDVLDQVEIDNPWRGNPLQVKAWLLRDGGQLKEAEHLMLEALHLQEQTTTPDILVAGTLADLGEMIGLQGRFAEAESYFEQSVHIIQMHEGQYDRQEARTKLKFAELLMRAGAYQRSLRLLDEADDKIRTYGHYYDLMWRIEMSRAFVYFRQRKLLNALRKIRSSFRYRHELSLPFSLLIRPSSSRWLAVLRGKLFFTGIY